MKPYEHRQHTTWMYWIAIVFLAMCVWLASVAPEAAALSLIPALILAAAIAMFSRLTTRVDSEAVSWSFGWGWPGGSIPLTQIASVQGTETSWLEGFGLHWTIWHGWLWNVGGFQAVEMITRSGGRVTLGTDDPQGLYDAIVAHRNAL